MLSFKGIFYMEALQENLIFILYCLRSTFLIRSLFFFFSIIYVCLFTQQVFSGKNGDYWKGTILSLQIKVHSLLCLLNFTKISLQKSPKVMKQISADYLYPASHTLPVTGLIWLENFYIKSLQILKHSALQSIKGFKNSRWAKIKAVWST